MLTLTQSEDMYLNHWNTQAQYHISEHVPGVQLEWEFSWALGCACSSAFHVCINTCAFTAFSHNRIYPQTSTIRASCRGSPKAKQEIWNLGHSEPGITSLVFKTFSSSNRFLYLPRVFSTSDDELRLKSLHTVIRSLQTKHTTSVKKTSEVHILLHRHSVFIFLFHCSFDAACIHSLTSTSSFHKVCMFWDI